MAANCKDIYDAGTPSILMASATKTKTYCASLAWTPAKAGCTGQDVIAHVTAITTDDADETYNLVLYASTTTGAKTTLISSATITATGHYNLGRITQDRLNFLNSSMTYLDMDLVIAGTTPSITMSAYLVPGV